MLIKLICCTCIIGASRSRYQQTANTWRDL